MYINNDDFEKWMERLSKKLNDIGKDLKSLVNTNEVSTRTKNCWIIRICVSCSGAANALFNATEVMAFYPSYDTDKKSTIGQTMFVHLFGNIAIIELFRSLKRTIHPKSKPMQRISQLRSLLI